jgi:hypothetical protein
MCAVLTEAARLRLNVARVLADLTGSDDDKDIFHSVNFADGATARSFAQCRIIENLGL